MFDKNTRAYTVTMTVYASQYATIDDVQSVIDDMSWVGGCRTPDDPGFDGLVAKNVKVKRARQLDRKLPE
jgi:hypothetical protein